MEDNERDINIDDKRVISENMEKNLEENIYLKNVYEKLRRDNFELMNDRIDEFSVVVATKKQFKLSWAATQLNIFVIMGVSEHISKDVIENFSKISLDYTIKKKKGLPRGLQAGVASFALLVSSNIDEDAKRWVQQKPKKHFAAFEVPVIFDEKSNKLYYCDKTPLWGRIYYKFFRKFIEKYFK